MTAHDQENLNKCLLQQAKAVGLAGIDVKDLHQGARYVVRGVNVPQVEDAANAMVNLGLLSRQRIALNIGFYNYLITDAGESVLQS